MLQTSHIPVDSPSPAHGCPSSYPSSRLLSPAFHPGSQPKLFLPTPPPHPQTATTFCLSVPFKNLSWIRPFFSLLRDTVSVRALVLSCLDHYSRLLPGLHPSPSPLCLFCFCQQSSSLWWVDFVRCPLLAALSPCCFRAAPRLWSAAEALPLASALPFPGSCPCTRAPAPLTFPASASAVPCVAPLPCPRCRLSLPNSSCSKTQLSGHLPP